MFFRDTDFQAVDNEIEEAIADRTRSDASIAAPEQTKLAPTDVTKLRATNFYAPGHEPMASSAEFKLPVVSPSDRLVSAETHLKPQPAQLSVIYAAVPVLLVFTALRCLLPVEMGSALTAVIIYFASYAVPAAYDVTEMRRTVAVLAIFNALLQGSLSGLAIGTAMALIAAEAVTSALAWHRGRTA
jgi:hypothetical protein